MTDPGPILTLEPLLEAVKEGLEGAGWELSGLQKTTSYEFEGRWAGDSSRSAYLFFHSEEVPEWVSLDVFLDETSRGLKGNLALVVDGPELSAIRDPAWLPLPGEHFQRDIAPHLPYATGYPFSQDPLRNLTPKSGSSSTSLPRRLRPGTQPLRP